MTNQDLSEQKQMQETHRQSQPAPTKSLRLTREKAARWLILFSQLSSSETTSSSGITKLRDELEDDCWLARWKGEEVIFDICPTLIAEVIVDLLQILQGDISADNAEVLEELIHALSSGSPDNFDNA